MNISYAYIHSRVLIKLQSLTMLCASPPTQVRKLLNEGLVTTQSGTLPIGSGVTEVSICCHSDTPGSVLIANSVKRLVDESNASLANA